jgi:co-chaperonin GroES (HSP10)
MKFVPLKKNVLVANIERVKTTLSGIIIEGTSGMSDNETGRVLEIGSEVNEVAVGDEILLDWAKSTPVKVDGEQRVVITEEFIIAVIER